MDSSKLISSGKILIAEPFLTDTHFKRTVVLLTDYSFLDGAVGFIMNKRLGMKINELLSDFPEFDADVLFGGPMHNDTIHYIHNVGDLLEGSIEIMNGLYWGGDFTKLKFLIESKLISPDNIRFFVGYSGWSAGQLDDELKEKTWVLSDMDVNYLFKNEDVTLWEKSLKDLGDTFEIIADVPNHMRQN